MVLKASRAKLTLSYMGDVVTLDVRDDGVGFQVPNGASHRDAGFGLTAMRQRVNRVAGTLAVESEPLECHVQAGQVDDPLWSTAPREPLASIRAYAHAQTFPVQRGAEPRPGFPWLGE